MPIICSLTVEADVPGYGYGEFLPLVTSLSNSVMMKAVSLLYTMVAFLLVLSIRTFPLLSFTSVKVVGS